MRDLLFITGEQNSALPEVMIREAEAAGLRPVLYSNGRESEECSIPCDAELKRALERAEAIIVQDACLDADRIALAARCEIIAHAGAGPGGIELEAARRAGIRVTSVPDFATAQYTSLVIGLLDSIVGPTSATKSTKAGSATNASSAGSAKWESSGDPPLFVALRRRPRLGILGLGDVGLAVARAARSRGWEVWARDPFSPAGRFEDHGVRGASSEQLAGVSDVLVVLVPLTDSTRALVDDDYLDLMQAGSVLISPGPSELVDPEALLGALQAGRPGRAAVTLGAALDDPSDMTSDDSRINQDLRRRIDVMISEKKLTEIRLDFLAEPEVLNQAIAGAVGRVGKYFATGGVAHLLVDPALPRVTSGIA